MKRRSVVAGLALMVVIAAAMHGALTSCARKQEPPPKPQTFRISGSGTTIPFIQALADAFVKNHPGVVFEYLPSTHTAGGVNGVDAGELEIGALSRQLNPQEEALKAKSIWIARDPLIFLVHHDLGVSQLTEEQVRKIYGGQITNWKQVGGIDREIVVLDRPEHASAKIVLRDTLLGKDFKVTPRAVGVERAGDMDPALAATPGGIAYTSWGLFVEERKSQGLDLAIVRINGVYPEESSVKSGSYPWVRPVGISVPPEPSPQLQQFIDFVASPEGVRIITDLALIPW